MQTLLNRTTQFANCSSWSYSCSLSLFYFSPKHLSPINTLNIFPIFLYLFSAFSHIKKYKFHREYSSVPRIVSRTWQVLSKHILNRRISRSVMNDLLDTALFVAFLHLQFSVYPCVHSAWWFFKGWIFFNPLALSLEVPISEKSSNTIPFKVSFIFLLNITNNSWSETEGESHSVMSDSATLWTVALQAPLSTEFSRQEYWSGSSSLLQGIFQTQRTNPGLLQCIFSTIWATGKIDNPHQCFS